MLFVRYVRCKEVTILLNIYIHFYFWHILTFLMFNMFTSMLITR